ncbi:MAG: tRNA pseudouridine(55) synthase TruB [Candidatus Eremiobacteraeota bacterium]|nr:tRNA pseudouridine(55) synthase TruB [Candidatus Eremiobacteraeota bacterium]MBV9647833.1 tRNA pseudouridine(55) synthase TruB [Candidatus Eremiobacteraeota bacterium]
MNAFKPPGISSAQFGARVRRIYSVRGRTNVAAGHLGTLDPDASGVLPLAIGKATRLIPLIEDRRKAYAFVLALGRATDTGDASGKTVRETSIPADAEALLEAASQRFVGPWLQVPPMFSAVHIDGRRLYELARAGRTVERKARRVTLYDLRILGFEGTTVRMRVACSEGTYVRALCEDLGNAIGVAAHLAALLREASGPFVLYESLTLEQIEAAPEIALVPPERVIPFPTIVLDGRGAADFRAGRMVPLPNGAVCRHVFVRDATRSLVGVGEAVGALLAPRKVFV